MKKKVLLMGASGSGKTSMRSLIFSNNPASLTSRLGATIDVEQNHVRFLGDLILNLWDCGGQDAFMDSYLSTQQSTIFQHVGVLIYVFDVAGRDVAKDMNYYRDCLAALRRYSPSAAVFTLVHKMDLARSARETTLGEKTEEIQQASEGFPIKVFGTSIYDESLYKAWSRIARTLIPNTYVLSKHLTTLATACSATEVVLFERTTFLVIATSSSSSPSSPNSSPPQPIAPAPTPAAPTSPALSTPDTITARASSFTASTASEIQTHHNDMDDGDPHKLAPARYERTSELIKSFKHACARVREEFRAMELELADFTAVLDELTKNTYVLVIVHDPTIETAAIRMNIRLARKKFEELQSDSLVS